MKVLSLKEAETIWAKNLAARIKQEARERAYLTRRLRRMQKLNIHGLEWIVKKGWHCFICGPGVKIGSWTKAHAHVQSDKHLEAEMMGKLAQ